MNKPNSVDAASLHPIVPRPLADEVADKAKRVFELMQRIRGSKAFGSIVGTDILITIERLNEESERPAWWPDDWEWPPISAEQRDAASENARLHNEACDSETVKDPYKNCKNFSEVCQMFMKEDPQMRKFFGKEAKQ